MGRTARQQQHVSQLAAWVLTTIMHSNGRVTAVDELRMGGSAMSAVSYQWGYGWGSGANVMGQLRRGLCMQTMMG